MNHNKFSEKRTSMFVNPINRNAIFEKLSKLSYDERRASIAGESCEQNSWRRIPGASAMIGGTALAVWCEKAKQFVRFRER